MAYNEKVAVAKLSREDLSAFRDWFQEFDAEVWDKQCEADVATGLVGQRGAFARPTLKKRFRPENIR